MEFQLRFHADQLLRNFHEEHENREPNSREEWRMKPVAYITTSWDDGHPLDARVAELLAKYNLPGTFYVPRTSEYGTMSAGQLVELSSAFEIGAHTVRHVVLTGISEPVAKI